MDLVLYLLSLCCVQLFIFSINLFIGDVIIKIEENLLISVQMHFSAKSSNITSSSGGSGGGGRSGGMSCVACPRCSTRVTDGSGSVFTLSPGQQPRI